MYLRPCKMSRLDENYRYGRRREKKVVIIPMVKSHANNHKDQEDMEAMDLGEMEENRIRSLKYSMPWQLC